MSPSQEDDLSAFETAKHGEDTKYRTIGERQRQTKWLSVDRSDRVLQELM